MFLVISAVASIVFHNDSPQARPPQVCGGVNASGVLYTKETLIEFQTWFERVCLYFLFVLVRSQLNLAHTKTAVPNSIVIGSI